jgi:hypothetical protein
LGILRKENKEQECKFTQKSSVGIAYIQERA